MQESFLMPFNVLRPLKVDGAKQPFDVDNFGELTRELKNAEAACYGFVGAAVEGNHLYGDIGEIPGPAWKPGVTQDGQAEDDSDVAEITGLMSRAGNWPPGLRCIIRRVKPSRRHLKNHRLREGDRLEIQHHLHEHPRRRDRGSAGQPARPVH
jgi:hypothetical protein